MVVAALVFLAGGVAILVAATREPTHALTCAGGPDVRSHAGGRIDFERGDSESVGTVAMGYPPVMPTFAGQLTEAELQALIEYLKSLSARP